MFTRYQPFRIFAISLLFALIACQPKSSPPAALSATLTELTGTVDIKQPGSSDFAKAAADMTLQESGSVQTGDDGRVRLDLSTGTIIRISPSSLFTLASNQQSGGSLSTQLKLTLGRIFVILKGGSMNVDSPSGVASVRGSYMSVEVDPTTGDVYVTCLEGHCSANNPAGAVDFSNGQKTILYHYDSATGQYTAPGVGPMSPEDFQKWRESPEAGDILNQAYATLTAIPPIPTPTNTPEAAATEAPAPGPAGCDIIGPLGGSELPKYGPVTFAWNGEAGATKYIVTFHYPGGGGGIFETNDTNLKRYAETLPKGGDYSWDVTALDGSGNRLCKSQVISFSKFESGPDELPACTEVCNPDSRCYDAVACGQ